MTIIQTMASADVIGVFVPKTADQWRVVLPHSDHLLSRRDRISVSGDTSD